METVTSLQQSWKPEPILELLKAFDAFKAENGKGTGFFLVKNNSGKISLESLAKFDTFYSNEDQVRSLVRLVIWDYINKDYTEYPMCYIHVCMYFYIYVHIHMFVACLSSVPISLDDLLIHAGCVRNL